MYNKILTELGQDYYKENFPNDGQRFVAGTFATSIILIHLKQKIALRMEPAINKLMQFISTTSRVQFTLSKANFMVEIL